jgi:NRPS condensation-like uncharacterized protein
MSPGPLLMCYEEFAYARTGHGFRELSNAPWSTADELDGGQLNEAQIPGRLPASGGDIASAAMRPMLEMVLGSRLTFTERLDPDALARAVRLLLDLEPVLGCSFDERLLSADWVRCPDLDRSVPFSMADTDDPDHNAAVFHSTPFGSKAPRLAVLLLRSRDHDDVCVRFDHVAGDGWSAKEVTHLLGETYSRLSEDPYFAPPARIAPRPTHKDVWEALSDEQRAATANTPKMAFSNWSIKLKRGAGHALAIRSLTLSPERVAAIRVHAHTRGATVNEALLAAFARSVASMSPPKKGARPGISVSADPRRFAEGADLDRVANIATTQTVLFDYRHGETFDETLQHVVEGVKPWRDSLWSIGGSFGREASDPRLPKPIVLRAMFRFLTTSMRVGHAAALVTMNVGALDEERIAFGPARPSRAVVTGPIPRFSGFATTISSYRDVVTLWMGFRENRTSPELIERCLTGIGEELAAAVQAGPT